MLSYYHASYVCMYVGGMEFYIRTYVHVASYITCVTRGPGLSHCSNTLCGRWPSLSFLISWTSSWATSSPTEGSGTETCRARGCFFWAHACTFPFPTTYTTCLNILYHHYDFCGAKKGPDNSRLLPFTSCGSLQHLKFCS